MSETKIIKAVIYCRVSSKRQETDGTGLDSQATTCGEYARYRGYTVVRKFEDGRSGKFASRPGMKAMLAYLREHRKERFVVVIDDISRLARDIRAHLKLRDEIARVGARLDSPTMQFSESRDLGLEEGVKALFAQEQRVKNAEQTRSRMRARVQNGYYVFAKPVGYRWHKRRGQGSVLVRDEPVASIVQEALEGYASGRFQIQAEVKRFLEAQPEFPRVSGGIVLNQTVTNILTRSVYAGLIEAPEWGISLRKGHHEPLISVETFRKIQARLNGGARTPNRADLDVEFPLRGFVLCGDCGSPLTACYSKGRTALHPYYLCFKRGCQSYRKSIRREAIEQEFEGLLQGMTPPPSVLHVTRMRLEDLWNHRLASQADRASSLKAELVRIERDVEKLLDQIVEVSEPVVMRAFQNRIGKLEAQKLEVSEKIANCGRTLGSFDETVRTAFDLLENPLKIWGSERFEHKRAVLKLAFAERPAYVRNQGFRTPNPALPFKALADFSGGKTEMARPTGFEPATCSFGGCHSIHLSYGRVRGRILRSFHR